MPITEIPRQAVEISTRVRLFDDSRIQVTLFPLPSHLRENPLDTLNGFLNGRRAEFFPARLIDGTATLLPLSHCFVVELTHDQREEVHRRYPEMARESKVASESGVVTFARVVITLTNRRVIRGTLWFHEFTPTAERNVLDSINQPQRYVMVHAPRTTMFVRRSAILYVQPCRGEEATETHPSEPSWMERRPMTPLVGEAYAGDTRAPRREEQYSDSYREFRDLMSDVIAPMKSHPDPEATQVMHDDSLDVRESRMEVFRGFSGGSIANDQTRVVESDEVYLGERPLPRLRPEDLEKALGEEFFGRLGEE